MTTKPQTPGWATAWRDPSRVSVSRSFVLAGAAAVIGLLLAGAGLFSARGTSSLVIPPEDIALVNQQPLARSDVLAQLRTLYGVDPAQTTPDQRRKVLDDMIREELLVQRGKELDVASFDPDVRSAMVAAVEQSVAADAMSRQPRDAELHAYYDAHKDRYAGEGVITVRDLVFDSVGAADLAAQALRSGAAPDVELARDRGHEGHKTQGEEFYFAARIHLGDALFDVARRLRANDASAPIAEPDGIHVLAVSQNTPPVARPFETARDQVLNDLRTEQIAALQAKSVQFLRKRANILIAGDFR